MKNILLTPALVALLGLALAGAPVTVQAQTTTTAPVPAAAPAVAPKVTEHIKSDKNPSYEGLITAIDATSVTVASTKKTLTLAITPATKFKKDKAKATLADFAVGDKVTGSFTTDATGAMSAASLHKKTMKPAKPAPANPATN